MMKKSDFQFELPPELIAHFPPAQRGDSRLMVLEGNGQPLQHRQFTDLQDYLAPGDLLVLNNTKVIPARVLGRKKLSGGQVEVLVERVIDQHRALCHMRASKAAKAGTVLALGQSPVIEATVLERQGPLFLLEFEQPVLASLALIGHMPLPPYIEREDQALDAERYQTVFAQRAGAVAAPTAGLHFSSEHLAALQARGVEMAEITLHVGSGTFQPVRVDDLSEHVMHSEWLQVDESLVEAVARTRARGGRVVAVGTTAMRALESAAQSGQLLPYQGETQLFITPGYEFQVVDKLVTNFHLSESTLLMLVSAFAGYEPIRQAYQTAIEQRYRFFSYGDAMLLSRQMDDQPSTA